MANGNRFVNLDREIVAEGLSKLVNQGIGTTVGGIPSFNDSDMRKFLTARNLDTPTTIPNRPLEDQVGSIAVDSSLQISQDLSGVHSIRNRITEALARKNDIAAQNLKNIESDPQVASAKESLNQATTATVFNFVAENGPLLEKQRQQAESALITAETAAKQRAAIKTAADVVDIDNEVLRLQNQERNLQELIAQEERTRPTITTSQQQAVIAAEGLEDLTQVQTTFDNYTAEKKQMVRDFAALDEGKFWAWDEPLVQDIDRDAYIAMVKSRLTIEDGRRFKEMIPQFDRQLNAAQTAATDALAVEQASLVEGNLPPISSFAAQQAWINTHIAGTMNTNTGTAYDTFVKGTVPEAITREGFSSDEMWRTAQQLQTNMDPTKAKLDGAISSALGNMPRMEPEKRTQLITEYLRKTQNIFNEPRNAFGMGINQVTIDILADDISSRMNRIDGLKIRADALKSQQELFAEEQADPLGERFITSPGIGGVPDSRQVTGPTTILTTGQAAVDVALAPVLAAQDNGTQAVNTVRAARIAAANPGLLDEEVAMLASSDITGVSNFLNELNPEEVALVTSQLRQAASLATDPAEKNMFNLLLNKLDNFNVQSRQPQQLRTQEQ